jgi:hypothetical protein
MDTNTFSSKVEDKPEPLATTTIRIIGIEQDSNDLIIQGGERTITEPDKWIVWDIDTEKVEEIYLVLPDYDPSTIFNLKPNNHTGSWKGRIKKRADFPHGSHIEEKYTIIYKKRAPLGEDPDNKLYIYDPIIQVNT